MLEESFSGLYCPLQILHAYQCQPALIMNTQQLYVLPYPGVDHLIKLLAQTREFQSLVHLGKSLGYLCKFFSHFTIKLKLIYHG